MEFDSPPYTVSVRRNPPRKAKITPATHTPHLLTASTPFVSKDIRPFSLEENLQCEVPQKLPSLLKTSIQEENSENIRVFLRIRPLNTMQSRKKNGDGEKNARSRSKGISPKQEVKKNEICLFVNDARSVTLSPPQSMQDSKRVKTEIYDGFSHVFEPDSFQNEVYERVMDPLVLDFIGGKSGMLVAMGPTGSGKTHTIFGCPREPGMIPLALQKIFNRTDINDSSKMTRSYYISMFEIYSERGKGEKICDLSSDGADLCLQQSAIKGLQEVMVLNVTEAEALIARGMLKRATAMTNSNSQSSRSQCIISIHSAPKVIDGEVEVLPNNAVLTIVDLAGAEKEKKTGNQGTRLLESNFINNTSMVFSLCLRSLLEHQKNPKKPLQKHFQSSLLTRYLRDYLEGKKRMTLILTVKPGSHDYLDTSFLLRQASPYMKIKFKNVEEPYQKRRTNTLPRVEEPKRRKFRDMDANMIDEGKSARDEHPIREKEVISESLQQLEPLNVATSSPRSVKLEMKEKAQLEEYSVELARMKRKEQVLLNFSKALWNVLKQYKEKLEESEDEIKSIKMSLYDENSRYLELKKELADLKSYDHAQHSTGTSSGLEVVTDAEIGVTGPPQLTEHESNSICEGCRENLTPVVVDSCTPNLKTYVSNLEKCDTIEEQSQETSLQTQGPDIVIDDSKFSVKDLKQQNYQNFEIIPERGNNAEDLKDLKHVEIKDSSSSADIAESGLKLSESIGSLSQSQVLVGVDNSPMVGKTISSQEEMALSKVQVSPNEEVVNVDTHNASKSESKHMSPCKSLNVEKPRRRLLPASSILLKEINDLDLEDEREKPKASRGGKKFAALERGRTQGSMSLLRLLRGNDRL